MVFRTKVPTTFLTPIPGETWETSTLTPRGGGGGGGGKLQPGDVIVFAYYPIRGSTTTKPVLAVRSYEGASDGHEELPSSAGLS